MGYSQWNIGLYNKIKNDIQNAIVSDLIDYIYNIMKEEIQKEVYDKFSPKSYKRRYEEGGLLDTNLFEYELIFSQRGFKIRVFTNAKGAGFDKNYSLDKYIVEGIYQYPNSPEPRDFYKYTIDNLSNGGKVNSIIKSALIKKGINMK